MLSKFDGNVQPKKYRGQITPKDGQKEVAR